MKLIYLASPYTHALQAVMDLRELEITLLAATLTKAYGYAMFLPITQSAPMQRLLPTLGHKFGAWAKIDKYVISKVDEVWVAMLDGWKESVGVTEEIKYATKLGIPVKYIEVKINGKEVSYKFSTKHLRSTIDIK